MAPRKSKRQATHWHVTYAGGVMLVPGSTKAEARKLFKSLMPSVPAGDITTITPST